MTLTSFIIGAFLAVIIPVAIELIYNNKRK